MRPVIGALASAAAIALAGQFGPVLTVDNRLRRRLTPRLAGEGAPGHVALTFDDGPVPTSTPAFLRALDELGWRATFFMLGHEVRRAPALAAEVVAAGHEAAVHGDEHANLLRRTPTATWDDLRRGRDTVAWATGVQPSWFRPPYGILSGTSVIAARRLGLRPVLWTCWGRDWRAEATPFTVFDDVATELAPGGTILLHDNAASGSWRATLDSLPRLAGLLDGLGVKVGPLAEHWPAPENG